MIRPATAADRAAVAAIYNEGIEDRLATFETRPRTPEEVAAWLEDELPFLVATNGGSVVGVLVERLLGEAADPPRRPA